MPRGMTERVGVDQRMGAPDVLGLTLRPTLTFRRPLVRALYPSACRLSTRGLVTSRQGRNRGQKKGRAPKRPAGTARRAAYFSKAVQILLYMSFTSFGQGGTNSGTGEPAGALISGALAKAGSMNLSLPMIPLL